MGYGNYSRDTYTQERTARRLTNISDFAYNEQAQRTLQIHPNLDPKRIRNKPFGKLESRDTSIDLPSFPIIVNLDVTGSNKTRAVAAQEKLNELMASLAAKIANPQVAIWANDDVEAHTYGFRGPFQCSDFESDNRIDEHLRNLWLVGDGGGNSKESYDLPLYAATFKTVTDSFEKRGLKGLMFMYADEPFPDRINPTVIVDLFGDAVESLSIQDLIVEARRLWDIYILAPVGGCIHDSRSQYSRLFGEQFVRDLEHPDVICEAIASIVESSSIDPGATVYQSTKPDNGTGDGADRL